MPFDPERPSIRCALLALVLGGCAACSSVAALKRLRGPEDPTVARGLSGIILAEDSSGRVTRIDVPSLERDVVIPPRSGVRGLSNVDDSGEFVYAQYMRPWQLVLVTLDSKETRVVASSDRPVRDHQIGDIALTADGARAALAWDAKHSESGHRVGHLEIVTLAQGETAETGLIVCTDRMSWLPDGQELVVEVLLPAAEADAVTGKIEWTPVDELEGFVSGVVALDPETGLMRALAAGHAPVLSGDGSCVLSRQSDGSYALTDLASGSSTPLQWPGNHAGPIAVACDAWVVYFGLPTAGRTVISTPYYSPMVGPRELPDVKVADPFTGEFATLLEGVDIRHPLSFSWRSP